MSEVYLLKNQHDEYLEKSGEWVLDGDSKSLYRTEHKDEAINMKVEFSVKKPDIRITLEKARYDEKGKLVLASQAAKQAPAADNTSIDEATSEEKPKAQIVAISANPDSHSDHPNGELPLDDIPAPLFTPHVPEQENVDDLHTDTKPQDHAEGSNEVQATQTPEQHDPSSDRESSHSSELNASLFDDSAVTPATETTEGADSNNPTTSHATSTQSETLAAAGEDDSQHTEKATSADTVVSEKDEAALSGNAALSGDTALSGNAALSNESDHSVTAEEAPLSETTTALNHAAELSASSDENAETTDSNSDTVTPDGATAHKDGHTTANVSTNTPNTQTSLNDLSVNEQGLFGSEETANNEAHEHQTASKENLDTDKSQQYELP